MQTRLPDGDADLPVLEQLLRDPRPELHLQLAERLWSAPDLQSLLAACEELAAAMPPVRGELVESRVSNG